MIVSAVRDQLDAALDRLPTSIATSLANVTMTRIASVMTILADAVRPKLLLTSIDMSQDKKCQRRSPSIPYQTR